MANMSVSVSIATQPPSVTIPYALPIPYPYPFIVQLHDPISPLTSFPMRKVMVPTSVLNVRMLHFPRSLLLIAVASIPILLYL